MNTIPEEIDVLIIGAGPSGAIASALLNNKGHKVLVMEKQQFPRFSIGESLLPQCMVYVEEAGMLDAVNNAGFQFKNGATFRCGDAHTHFDFTEKFSEGPGTTFQVERAKFDKLLADEAEQQGVDILYQHTITGVEFLPDYALVTFINASGAEGTIKAGFILDASGFGRVLPRLLDLEQPSDFPIRKSIFTHIDDHIIDEKYDRDKIIITINPNDPEIWYWLIPFGDGRCSLGVVAETDKIELRRKDTTVEHIKTFVAEAPELHNLLENAKYNYPANEITGYSADVKSLWGERFALLGNAGEFLDPVFSSGVTIAMRSASLAACVLDKQLNGEKVDWHEDYAAPLMQGVDTFRVFVDAWYDGRFQDILFYGSKNESIRNMISSILAGYAWDTKNPFVAQSERRMNALVGMCRMQAESEKTL